MGSIIDVQGLSKSYLLRHKRSEVVAYRTLRESLVQAGANILQRARGGREESDELFWALRDVSFSVAQGERLAIIGRNGAGKSTLLKILSRITDPTSGSVRIRGRLSSLLEVGTGFHPELTGRENIFLNGAVLGMSRDEVRRKFDAIVDFSEAERFLDTPVKRYSSGMYVKLAFAVSAFLDPDILVLDEVLSVGDAAFQRKSQQKMQKLTEDGRTVIFVSHSMGAIKALCNTAVVLNAGVASEKMRVDEAITHYLDNGASSASTGFPIERGEVRLLAFDFLQHGGPAEEFDGESSIDIRIRLHLAESLSEIRIGFYVRTPMGSVVFRHLVADWNPGLTTLSSGVYDFISQIPSNFLVEGAYVVEFHCSRFGICDYFDNSITKMIRVRRSRDFDIAYPADDPVGAVHLQTGWQIEKVASA